MPFAEGGIRGVARRALACISLRLVLMMKKMGNYSHYLFDQRDTVLRVVLVYEDLCTGLRAKRALERLPGDFMMSAGFQQRLWRTDLLRIAVLNEQAAREASQADVVMISLHGTGGMLAEIRDLLGRWLAYKQERPYGLGVLLDREAMICERKGPVLEHLQEVAKRGGADLFCGYDDRERV